MSGKSILCIILSMLFIVQNFNFHVLELRAEQSSYQVSSYYPEQWYTKRWQPVNNEAGGFWVPGYGPNSTIPGGPEQYYPSFHFHSADDGTIAYCMQADLANPDGTTEYTNVSSDGISKQFGADRLVQVSNILKRGYPLGGDLGLPEDAAQEATQIAIWHVLSGTVGNESELWGNLDWLQNNNADIPTIETVKWLIQESTKPVEHEITISCENESKDVDFFYYDLTILVKEMSKGILLSFENLPAQSVINDILIDNQFHDPNAKNGEYHYQLKVPRLGNENSTIQVSVNGLDERDSADMYFYQTNGTQNDLPYQMLAVALRTQNEYKGNSIEIKTGENFGNIRVWKRDKNDNQNLAGAVFGLFKDIDGTDLFATLPATDEKGESSLFNILPGVYYLKELQAPYGYKMNMDVHEITVHPDTETELTVHNEQERNKIRIQKVDGAFQTPLQGAVFEIYRDELCNELISTMQATDNEGIAESEWLPLGVYYVKEKKSPDGYYVSNDVFKVEISSATTPVHITVSNKKIVGKIKIQKNGEQLIKAETIESTFGSIAQLVYDQVNLEGVIFSIYKDETCSDKVGEIITNEDGYGELDELVPGTYYIKETKVPEGYLVSDQVYSYEVKPEAEEEVVLGIDNERGLTKIKIHKTGKGEETFPLKGVTFGIYNAQPLFDLDGNTILEKNQLMAVAHTDNEGIAMVTLKLPLGKYYFTELETPEGFVPSREVFHFEITSTSQKETVIELNKEDPLINEQASGKLIVNKTDEYKNPIEEVEFTLTCRNNNKAYSLKTDVEGKAVLEHIPIGSYDTNTGIWTYFTYELKETGPKEGYEGNDEIHTIQFKQSEEREAVIEYGIEIINKRMPSKTFILGIEDYYKPIGTGAIITGIGISILGMFVYKKRQRI